MQLLSTFLCIILQLRGMYVHCDLEVRVMQSLVPLQALDNLAGVPSASSCHSGAHRLDGCPHTSYKGP